MRSPRRMLQQVADRVLLGELRQLEPTRTSVAAYHRTLNRLTRTDLNFIRGQAWMRCDPDYILLWFGHDEGPRMEFNSILKDALQPLGDPAPLTFSSSSLDTLTRDLAVQTYRDLFPGAASFRIWSNPGADL